jgi:hypothetical protein
MKSEKFQIFEIGKPDPLNPDPVHNDADLWAGIDAATTYPQLGLSLADIATALRHCRHAAILVLARIGAELAKSKDGVIGLPACR